MYRNTARDELDDLDVEVVKEIIRFGALTDQHVNRCYGQPEPEGASRLHRLEAKRFVKVGTMDSLGVTYVFATRKAIRAVESELRPLDHGPRHLEHDLSVASLAYWLLAQNPGAEWLTERQLRHDDSKARRFGRQLSQPYPPDGALIVNGRKIGIELEKRFANDEKYARKCRWYAEHIEFHEVHWYVLAPRLLRELPRIVGYHGLSADIQIVTQLIPLEVELVGWERP